MTDAERKLWLMLCNRRLGDTRFLRQHPLGPYVLDFYCERLRLAVEVDGSQHGDGAMDAERTAWLAARCSRVIRFWDNEVLQNREAVMTAIQAVVRELEAEAATERASDRAIDDDS